MQPIPPIQEQFSAFTTKPEHAVIMPVLMNEVRIRQAASLIPDSKIGLYKAIWDTGANMTAISPIVVEQLDLKPFSAVTIHYGDQSAESPVFKIDVILPNGVVIQDVSASEAKNIRGSDILVGMDIITTGDFAVTNANRVTWFSFRIPPALEHIDYVADVDEIIQKRKHKAQARKMQRKGKLH